MESITRKKDVAENFELIPVEWTFGTEELSAHSACLNDLAGNPRIFMNRSAAQELNLTDGERLSIELDSGAIEVELQIEDKMATGTLVLPRHKDLDWQKMHTGINLVRPDQIRKLKARF